MSARKRVAVEIIASPDTGEPGGSDLDALEEAIIRRLEQHGYDVDFRWANYAGNDKVAVSGVALDEYTSHEERVRHLMQLAWDDYCARPLPP